MALTLPLPRISTNVRFPEFAAAIAERLFLTPPKPRDAAAAAVDLIDARSSVLEHKGRHIVMWRWGSRDAPAVLLAHGWGGNAAQMRPFVFPLLEAGYRVIAYDQPAHGVSEGRLTGLPDFADVIAELAWHYGGVSAIVAHSLGAAAAGIVLGPGAGPVVVGPLEAGAGRRIAVAGVAGAAHGHESGLVGMTPGAVRAVVMRRRATVAAVIIGGGVTDLADAVVPRRVTIVKAVGPAGGGLLVWGVYPGCGGLPRG